MTSGGKREGAGRKPGSKMQEAKPRAIRMTEAEHQQYKQQGGLIWFRRKLWEPDNYSSIESIKGTK